MKKSVEKHSEQNFKTRFRADMRKNYPLYLMLIPVLAFYIIFCYKPMYGALIAFKDYDPSLGVWGSPWVGLKHFKVFFENPDFIRLLRNTLVISITSIVFGFPAPIILALLLNELKYRRFKSTAQTISYLPHFISLVVVCGLVKDFVGQGGIIHYLVTLMGVETPSLLSRQELFVPIYVISDIWQQVGWGSIIYLAALSGIDQSYYEAAQVDGAGKWSQLIHVTLPSLAPTIIIMLILRLGNLLNVGYEKIILLQNPLIYETSDVISSYVYRVGFSNQNWSYSSAVGLLNSVVNFGIVILANKIANKTSETSLW